MRIYIWHSLYWLTDNVHNGGSVVIITDRHYNDAWAKYLEGVDNRNLHIRTSIDEPPDLSYEVDEKTEMVFVYEDSGCC